MKNSDFSNFDCDPEIILKWLQHHGNLQWIPPPKNTMINFFFHKKKNSVRHPKMVVFAILRPNLRPLSGIEIYFSSNLTYSYSFLGWNLPEITMALNSLHNYFGITVKSRENDEKFGFFEFWLWSRNNVEMIATSRWSPVNSPPKNTMINFFFHKKKKFRPTSENGRFRDFETEPETPFGNRKFFFLKI